ncbi:hypothetical protein ACIQCF_18625 [Streptomyces sp. NPDC088353]|uniref:hypothetical protein n=1 Tax=unclassified Streptomyces TaxID=2593676 RepID=UPI00368D0B0B
MLSVQVRNARGEVLRKISADPGFEPVLLGVDAAVHPHLAALDPYGDTVFNYLQVRRLLGELDTYGPTCGASEEFLRELRELCTLALAGTHRFLWFIGN